MNHKETYESVCKANTALISAMYGVISDMETWERLRKISQMLQEISASEHEHIINEIQNQPIA